MAKTKNDKAWENIFNDYSILEEIQKHGFYEIEAKTIRKYREPRLMCKFDHENNLPTIFKKHKLSILPISRVAYIIGDFSIFAKVTYDPTLIPKEKQIPHSIESINGNDLYSESAALQFAYHSGMIDDFVGEQTKYTVNGRMGSGTFDYFIKSSAGKRKHVHVQGAQIEIDGGYEGKTKFVLIEAKKETASDFNMRQLYYPYRVWKNRVTKEVVPIFFTHSNDVFSFFMYEFTDEETFTSFKLIKQKNYIIQHDKITADDIRELVDGFVHFVPEPKLPFPQADSFVRVIDLLGLLYLSDLKKEEITAQYDFDSRQSDYYANACIYLGLAEKNDEAVISLNEEGRRILSLPYRQKYLALAEKILCHKIFMTVCQQFLLNEKLVTKQYVVEQMKTHDLYGIASDSTFIRRASTIIGWVRWIARLEDSSSPLLTHRKK